VETLTREIGQKAANVPEASDGDSIDLNEIETLPALERVVAESTTNRALSSRELPLSPTIQSREVVATTGRSTAFGSALVSTAWSQGLFQAKWKAYVGDGQNWIWSTWKKHFKPFGFIPILDVIHAVTYVYASAMGGHERKTL